MRTIKRRVRALLSRTGARRAGLWDAVASVKIRHAVFGDPKDTLIFALSLSRTDVCFIQVGSNDATHNDPLAPFLSREHWHGVMVEPVDYVFKRLVARYGGSPRFVLENGAIAEANEERDFFYLAETTGGDVPVWYDQLGSFSSELVLKHGHAIPDIRNRLLTARVRCMTFDALCAKHAIDAVSLIHIDAEGSDYEIIKLIDFNRYRPTLLLYEHKHLAAADRAAAAALLDGLGYRTLEVGPDTIAARADALESEPILTEAWDLARG